MFRLKNILFLVLIALTTSACEDVIDVDLPSEEPRLVIDALIRIPEQEGQEETVLAFIKLTTTAPFYDEQVPIVTGANATLNTGNKSYDLTDQSNGFYTAYIPREEIENEVFTLKVEYNNEVYSSTTKYVPTVPIDFIGQGDSTLFSGDEREVIVIYTDPAESDDYYLFDLDYKLFLVSEDEFYQGQTFGFSYFYEDLSVGASITIDILGVDKNFYDYMNTVINQAGRDTGGPFESPPATLRGNIVNTTNPDNFALGYFAIAQEYSANIVLE